MRIIELLLGLFGLGWLLLIFMLAIFGGKILIQLKNPLTKKMENITDVTIDHEK